MRTIAAPKSGTLHIEAAGCIVNIRTGLTHRSGRKVTSIEVLADGDRYAGDPEWWIVDARDRKRGAGQYVRVMQREVEA